jgi:4-amino-4-deoxy-L-arabinose transferase-like glycosyltransferase
VELTRGRAGGFAVPALPGLLLAIGIVLICAAPGLLAAPARLSSDESLYAAEALNIANGEGMTYPTGEPVTHRPPLFPALVALPLAVGGDDLDAAHLVPRLAAVANALLVLFLGRALFGTLAGAVGGVLAAASPYLNGMATTLFLDGTQTTLILATLLVYWRAYKRGDARLFGIAGLLLGGAFLVKESALPLLPLGVLMPFIAGRGDGWRGGIFAWLAGFAAATAWWWAWVYAHTGLVFLLGDPETLVSPRYLLLAGGGIAILAFLIAALPANPRVLSRRELPARLVAAGALLAWCAAVFIDLERTSWEYPADYISTIPAYVADIVMPNLQPFALVAAGWLWLLYRAVRGDRASTLVVVAATCLLPFAFVFANRGLALRDGLPLVYLSYVAVGALAVAVVDWGRRLARDEEMRWAGPAALGVVLVVTAGVALLGFGRVSRDANAGGLERDWDNVLAHDIAGWLEANVPAGTPVMSTRLYYSHVYFLNDGAYPIHQLPTTLVAIDPAAERPLSRRSTLFRWEPAPPDRPNDSWLYLTRYPVKDYYVGLAENDLLDELRGRDIEYVVVSLTDAGFSSPSFLPYFEANPAFSLVYSREVSESDRAYIYRVDRALLAPRGEPARVTERAFAGLEAELGSAEAVEAVLNRLSASGFILTPE